MGFGCLDEAVSFVSADSYMCITQTGELKVLKEDKTGQNRKTWTDF